MSDQLERIESKLDRLADDVGQIKVNQGRDILRFEQIESRFAEVSKHAVEAVELHDAKCAVKTALQALATRISAAENRAMGAAWASGKLWAAIVGALALFDIGWRVFHG